MADNRYNRRAGCAASVTPGMSREEYGAQLLRDALARRGDPAEALVRSVERMDGREAAALRQALDWHERGGAR